MLNFNLFPNDLTLHLAQALHALNADAITANTEVLSVAPEELKLLKPIDSKTLKDAAYYLIGRASTPYLLNGDLVIHDTKADTYYKILPNIREDGYTDYIFNAYSHSTLSSRIYRLQNLLKTSPEYLSRHSADLEPYDVYDDPFNDPPKRGPVTDEELGHIKYAPLPKGDPQARQQALADLSDWDACLLDRANDLFMYGNDERETDDVTDIARLHYYRPPVYLSAHKLAACVYYPVEYDRFISRPPLDPATGNPLVYHVHHKNLCRSDNTPENLVIITKQLNDELRSTSRPVVYQGKHYNTIKSYCEDTDAGARTKLTERLATLTPDTEAVEFNGRIYTIDPDTGIYKATDGVQAPTITFNGTTYPDLKAFATAQSLSHDAIKKGVYRARQAGKSEYKHKRYSFYLERNGNILIKTV